MPAICHWLPSCGVCKICDKAFCGLQEWSAYAQTKTARHKLTKFLKDHGHLLESDKAQSAASSPSEASSRNGASLNGASSAGSRDVQVSCPTLCPECSGFCLGILAVRAAIAALLKNWKALARRPHIKVSGRACGKEIEGCLVCSEHINAIGKYFAQICQAHRLINLVLTCRRSISALNAWTGPDC